MSQKAHPTRSITQQTIAPICADSVGLVLFIGTSRKNRRGSHWKEKIMQKMPVLPATLPLVTDQ